MSKAGTLCEMGSSSSNVQIRTCLQMSHHRPRHEHIRYSSESERGLDLSSGKVRAVVSKLRH